MRHRNMMLDSTDCIFVACSFPVLFILVAYTHIYVDYYGGFEGFDNGRW